MSANNSPKAGSKRSRRSWKQKAPRPRTVRPSFDSLESRVVPAGPSLTASTFSASLFADNLEAIVDGNVIGYGYAINKDGALSQNGGDGSARMAPDSNPLAFTSATKTEIASVAKPITAAATHKLLYEQNLPLSTPIGNYLPPEWDVHPSVAAITFAELMTHRSGFTTYVLTYAGLADLVETDVSATNGNKKYLTTNYSLLRVIIPYLWLGSEVDNIADDSPFTKDGVIASLYETYVKENVFEPAGVFDADTQLTGPNQTLLYAFPDDNTAGVVQENGLLEAGGKGWKLSALDLARFLRTLRHTESILSNEARELMDTPVTPGDYPGWSDQYGMFGMYLGHNGANHNVAGKKLAQAVIMNFPNDVEAAFVQNSNGATGLPSTFSRMIQAYDNAWTDLVIDGSSGNDTFELRINPNDSDLIDIKLGNTTYTRWIDSLDSLTLNGLGGADVFNIRDVPASLDLIINAGSGHDDVNFTDGNGYASILGDVLVHGDSGNDEFVFQAYLGGTVEIDGDTGNDSVRIDDNNGNYLQDYYVARTTLDKTSWVGHIEYHNLQGVELNTSDGNNIIRVYSTASGAPVTLNTNLGVDVILIGDDDFDSNIRSNVIVNGDFGTDVLAIQDREDNVAGDTYTIEPGQFSKSSLAAFVSWTFIQEVVLQTTEEADVVNLEGIEEGVEVRIYTYGGRDDVNLAPTSRQLDAIPGEILIDMGGDLYDALRLYDQDGTGDDAYTITEHGFNKLGFGSLEIENTPNVTLYANSFDNTIYVNELASDVHWTVRGGEGDDLFQVGYATRDLDTDLFGDLSLWGEAGLDELRLHDKLDQVGNDDYDIGNSSFAKTGTESWHYAGFEEVVLVANEFANTINVSAFGSDFADMQLTIKARGGNDEIILGEGYNRIDFINDHVFVKGGQGEDTIRVNDTARTSPRTFTFGDGTLDASGLFDSLSYTSIANLVVEAGSSADVFDVQGLSPATELTINGNDGDDDVAIAASANDGSIGVDGGTGVNSLSVHHDEDAEVDWTPSPFDADAGMIDIHFGSSALSIWYDEIQSVQLIEA